MERVIRVIEAYDGFAGKFEQLKFFPIELIFA